MTSGSAALPAHPFVGEPLRVRSGDEAAWDDAADVVVVGFGGAGVCAALQALEGGAEVLVLERFQGGGATALSGGITYAGGGTSAQRDAGSDDTPEEMFRYLRKELGDAVSEKTIRDFSETSAKSIAWLQGHGVAYDGTLYEPKTAYPPLGYHLYFSGNERMPAFMEVARPAPRGHRAYRKDWAGPSGTPFFEPLRASAERSGARVLTHSRASRLILNDAGRVVGVEILTIPEDARAAHDALYEKVKPGVARFLDKSSQPYMDAMLALEARVGQTRRVRARAGVILAAGGFVHNAAWLKAFGSTDYSRAAPLGRMGCDGAGIALGLSAGGAVVKMHRTFAGVKLAPPPAYTKGVLVTPEGDRFRSEEAYAGTLGQDMTEKLDGKARLIVDLPLLMTAIRQCMPDGGGRFIAFYLPVLANILLGGTKVGRSLASLARRTGMDPRRLAETIRTYNETPPTEMALDLRKSAANTHPLKKGPFFAINLSVSNKLAVTSIFTLGGLAVDERTGAVLDRDRKSITGLYAAGRSAVGLTSESYVSGMSIADAVYSGRRAGQHAAQGASRTTGRSAA